ncbi:hypothetical protein VNO78_27370 [Psophocarpus tetragonolobus]|uniref:Uncharacterized protein n=1 Tax=Psophocarpus tetragonolobus TaxID=3891 RepID=A0AAN9S0I4_PSOTE
MVKELCLFPDERESKWTHTPRGSVRKARVQTLTLLQRTRSGLHCNHGSHPFFFFFFFPRPNSLTFSSLSLSAIHNPIPFHAKTRNKP